MHLSAFGITAGRGKPAPSAGHDTSVCTLLNSSCSVGVVQVARGNRISRAPSPRTFRTFIFRQFWECKIVKNASRTAAGTALCSEFSFLQIPYNSVFSFQTFPCEKLGIPAAACTRPSLKQQPSNDKQQDNIKHHTSSCHIGSTAMGCCPRN